MSTEEYINKIVCGDCLEVMKNLDDNSIDLVVTDLPYNITALKWDKKINLKKIWKELIRIGKEDSIFIFTATQPFTSLLMISNQKMFREEIIWLKNKSGNGLNTDKKHIKIHEEILVFSKKGNHTFNPQKWQVEEREFLTQRKTLSIYGEKNQIYSPIKRTRKLDDGTRFPISVVAFRVPHNPSNTKKYDYNQNDIRFHPTQKPIKLIEYLIKTYSNENDIIFDPFAGIFTTCLIAKKLNRRYIGIEINEEYCKIAEERIKKVPERLDNILRVI